MKKFEEEFDKNVTSVALRQDGESVITLCDYKEAKAFGHDWVSPEDHQAEIAKLNSKIDWLHGLLDERNEEVLQTVKRLNEAQPEIREVPQFVADWYEENKGSLDYMIFETCIDLTDESTNEFEKWFGYDENKAITTLVNMKNGYTVAKEKRFYLKHKSVLIFDPDSDDSDVDELYLGAGGNFVPYQHLAKIFTQSEIDSMETGSYEQIPVEEK